MDLLHSIARVFADSNSDSFDGTAFLFAAPKENERQLWMTCHHVIRELGRLRLSCHTGDVPRVFECDYRSDLSSPQMDIAVLETRLTEAEVSSMKLSPLPVGAPPPGSAEERIIGCGFSNVRNHPRGVKFVGRSSAVQCLEIPNDDEPTRASIAQNGQPWNIPFEDGRQIDVYEFLDEGARVEPGQSGSPVCIEMDSIAEKVMCIGMLNTRRLGPNSVSTHGFVIPYEALKAACGNVLPFHAYADYVVVVLAATRSEFEELRLQLDMEELKGRCEHYDQNSRDEWRPFDLYEPAIRTLISEATNKTRSWQLSSQYLGQSDAAFEAYLKNRGAGALVLVVDRNTYGAGSLHRFLEPASNHNRDACYVFPLCKEMHSRQAAIERELQNDFSGLWSDWHRDRVKFSWRREDFADCFRGLLVKAWELFVHERRSYPRRRIGPAGKTAETSSFMDWPA